MGVRILHNAEDDAAVLYCSTTDWAFGPVFENAAHAEAFVRWCFRTEGRDPRSFTDAGLQDAHHRWLSLWAAEARGSRWLRFFSACRRALRAGFEKDAARALAWQQVREAS
jgi:hypothetical protein